MWRHCCRKLLMHLISKYFERGSEDLDHCLDTVYLICSISPLWKSKEQAVFRMSMLCIIAIVTHTYPALGLQDLFRLPCTQWNGWFPEISWGYWISPADETICDQYVNFFQSVWKGQGMQVLTSLSLSRHVFCWPAKDSHLDKERLLCGNLLTSCPGDRVSWRPGSHLEQI